MNVTLRTLLVEPDYTFIIWNFNDGREQTHVVTVGPAVLKVNAPYLGRVSVDARSGALHLSALTTADNGDFSVSVVSAEGDTETAEIRLRVLGESPAPVEPAAAKVAVAVGQQQQQQQQQTSRLYAAKSFFIFLKTKKSERKDAFRTDTNMRVMWLTRVTCAVSPIPRSGNSFHSNLGLNFAFWPDRLDRRKASNCFRFQRLMARPFFFFFAFGKSDGVTG